MVRVELTKVIDTSGETASEQLGYKITNFESFTMDVRTPISPMPLPEETAEQNVLVKIEGNTKVVSLSWTLVKSNTDLGFGSKKDSNTQILTVPQQLIYIADKLQGSSLQHRFKLHIYYSDIPGEQDLVLHGFVNNIQFNQTSTAPVTFSANLSFIVGSVITTLDGDIPNKATITSLTNVGEPAASGSPLKGSIKTTWIAPTYVSSGILDYDLEFLNTSSGQIEHKAYGEVGLTYSTGTVLTPDTEFQVRVRANSAEGEGRWSSFYPVTDEDSSTVDGVKSTS